MHESAEKANKLDKSNEIKIMGGVIADIKSKRDMLGRTNETFAAEFEDYVFQAKTNNNNNNKKQTRKHS